MKTKLEPMNDRLVVERLSGETKTAAGIVIPDSARERPDMGLVLAAGPGKLKDGEREPMTVKAGDKILFGKYVGSVVNVDKRELVFVREDEVLAIVREDEEQ